MTTISDAFPSNYLKAVDLNNRTIKLKIDKEHTSITFRVRHLFTKVSGRFNDFEGTIEFDEAALAASKVT